MKNLMLIFAAVLMLASSVASAATTKAFSPASFTQQVHLMKCTYDFAVNGGVVSSISLKAPDGRVCVLPSGAIIKQVMIDIVTPIVSTSNDGTIAVTAQSAGDLLAAVDGDTLSGLSAGVPTGAGANMIKLTADRTILGTIAVHAFTAGKFNVYIEWYKLP